MKIFVINDKVYDEMILCINKPLSMRDRGCQNRSSYTEMCSVYRSYNETKKCPLSDFSVADLAPCPHLQLDSGRYQQL